MENNILIICPSWEERSWLGFMQDCNILKIDRVISIEKEQPINGKEISECINRIKDFCKKQSIEYKQVLWNNTPTTTVDFFNRINDECSLESQIYLNITTMPRDIIWTLLSLFHQKSNKLNIRYYQPESYNDTWLSKEPYSPRLLLKHSGIFELGKPTCLLIITSFDTERTKQIITKFEPQKVVLCIQNGNQFDNDTRNNSAKHELICRDFGVNDVSFIEFNSFDSSFGRNTIEKVLASLNDYNIILASFGPKPSAIGIYMAYLTHPEIALCYVPCKEYNTRYCEGLGKLYSIKYK